MFCFWRIVAIERKHTPGAKAPLASLVERAKPEGLAYLEAKAETKAKIEAIAKSRSKGKE
jgi:hypothetical protein